MTDLSINLNKLALLRNSRGRDYPNLVSFAEDFIALGVQGLTILPRQDQRHITNKDAINLGELLSKYPDVELNIEGYPSSDFLSLVEAIKPDQCSLVPDGPNQLTSDHGWNLHDDADFELVAKSCGRLNELGIRSALFMDPELDQIQRVPATGAKRIELYTETYAASFGSEDQEKVWQLFHQSAVLAQELEIGVNAGHDLDLNNLGAFLNIPNILEVSIGHALLIECIERGMNNVIPRYLELCKI